MATPGCALQELDLSCTGLSTAEGEAAAHARGGAVALLAAALRGCACPLRALQLGGNQLRDADALVLAEALRERATSALATTNAAAEADATAPATASAAAMGAPMQPRPPSDLRQPRLDLSTNALSSEGLSALRALCEVVAPFQRPLCERTFVGFDKCVYGAAADEHALYLAHGGGPVVKIRTDDWKESGRFEGHADDVNCVALHGELLLSGSDDYSIKLWRTALGPAGESGCIASLTGHEARVWCVVATDEHIYSCGADKAIIAWSMAEAKRGTSTQVVQGNRVGQ